LKAIGFIRTHRLIATEPPVKKTSRALNMPKIR